MDLPRDPLTDLGPLPEVRESSTDTSWALFRELQDRPAEASRCCGSRPAVLAEAFEPVPRPGPSAEQVMLVACRRNRVCPTGAAWERFHDVLQAAARAAPPPPLTPSELARTSFLARRVRVRHQVEWAARHGVLHIAHAFLAGLAEDEWLHVG